MEHHNRRAVGHRLIDDERAVRGSAVGACAHFPELWFGEVAT
jgi:hypothetical protein